MKLFRLRLCLAVVLSLVATTTFAQTASISGRITDPDRAVVTDAEVMLTHIESGAQKVARSAADGTFMFADVIPGRYLVQNHETRLRHVLRRHHGDVYRLCD